MNTVAFRVLYTTGLSAATSQSKVCGERQVQLNTFACTLSAAFRGGFFVLALLGRLCLFLEEDNTLFIVRRSMDIP